MRAVTILYLLRDGTRGRSTVIARSTADAICMAIDTWGEALRMATARTPRSAA